MQPAFVQAGLLSDVQSLTSEGSSAVAGRSCSLSHSPQPPPTRCLPQPHRRPARRAGAVHARPQQRAPAGNLKGCKGRLCRHAHCASAAHAGHVSRGPACGRRPFKMLARAGLWPPRPCRQVRVWQALIWMVQVLRAQDFCQCIVQAGQSCTRPARCGGARLASSPEFSQQGMVHSCA